MRLRDALLCLLLPTSVLSTGLLAIDALSAEEVIFYRCTDAGGALTLQNMPCPKGSSQERKVMQAVSTVPMGATSASKAAPVPSLTVVPSPEVRVVTDASASAAESARSDASLLPPPHLFQCTTHDKDTYITESSEPQSRCVALRTVGLDGNPATGAGQACEVVRDTCARVADADLCAAWKKRLGETEVAWRFARPGNAAANQADHLRVQRILGETSCAEARGS